MSIQPPSDLLLDVMNAGDPQKAQAIAARLRQASASASANAAAFDEALAEATPVREPGTDPVSSLGNVSATTLANATALTERQDTAVSPAFRRFEAMALGGFIEQILPKASASLYGSGTAGQIWRSMLAERIADQVTLGGGIGLAQRIAAASTRRDAS